MSVPTMEASSSNRSVDNGWQIGQSQELEQLAWPSVGMPVPDHEEG